MLRKLMIIKQYYNLFDKRRVASDSAQNPPVDQSRVFRSNQSV
jgi:hypothetical protein